MEIKNTILNIQNMADGDIINNIPESKLNEIKEKDNHPVFKAFTIAHEGVSNGNIIGLGKTALRWLTNSVEKIYDKLKLGTKLFYNHVDGTNDSKGRIQMGEVVSKVKQVANGLTNIIAVGYIYPMYKDIEVDIASFEGDITLPDNLKNTPTIVPEKIRDITGIALGSSKKSQPAFKNATLQGALQMMAEGEKQMELTFEEVLKFVKNNKVVPSDLYDIDMLKDDSTVKNIVKNGNKDTYYQAKRIAEEKETLKTTYEKEITDLKSKLKDININNAKIQAEKMVKDIYTKRKLDDISIKFIDRKITKEFKPENPEELDKEINIFIDNKIDELTDLRKAGIVPDLAKKIDGVGPNTAIENKSDMEKVQSEL